MHARLAPWHGTRTSSAVRADRVCCRPRGPSRVMSLAANLQQRFDAALALHRAGDMQAAARAYRAILESHPQQPDALNLLALVEMEGGHHRTAVDLLRRAVSVSPQVAQFHCHLGNALQADGDFAAAATAYRNALALQAQFPQALTGLGWPAGRGRRAAVGGNRSG